MSPCLTCDGHGLVSYFIFNSEAPGYDVEPCPDCSVDPVAQVLDALQVATTKTLERTVHHFHFEIVDAQDVPGTSFHHVNVAVAGHHTEQAHSWESRVVKNDLMNIDKLHRLQAHLLHSLDEAKLKLVAFTVIYLEERQQFGFSILTQRK